MFRRLTAVLGPVGLLTSLAILWLLPSLWFFVTGNDDMFARFGSILVALSIIWVVANENFVAPVQGLTSKMDSLSKKLDAFDREDLKALIAKKEEILAEAKPDSDEIRGILENVEVVLEIESGGGLRRMLADIQAFSRKIEVAGLIVGTLQWGFGDLIVHKLIECGEWQCS